MKFEFSEEDRAAFRQMEEEYLHKKRARAALMQPSREKIILDQKRQQLAELKGKSMPRGQVQEVKVKMSRTYDGLEAGIIKIDELEGEIQQQTIHFNELRHSLTAQIRRMQNLTYKKILYQIYVRLQSFHSASRELGMSYSELMWLHREALDAFADVFIEENLADPAAK